MTRGFLALPKGSPVSVLLVSGTALRHQYAALRILAAARDAPATWLQVRAPAVMARPRPLARIRRWARAVVAGRRPPVEDVERRMLAGEVARLLATCAALQASVEPGEAAQAAAQARPALTIFIGVEDALERALGRICGGPSISVREGWSPEYPGANAVLKALYQRDLRGVGSTVEVTPGTPGAPGLLRRSTACVALDDDIGACLVRCAALGAELSAELVTELFAKGQVPVLPLPAGAAGGRDLPRGAAWKVDRMLARGFVQQAASEYETF